MAWEDHAMKMDDKVDFLLGDDLELSTNSGGIYIPVKGFVKLPTEALGDLSPLDEVMGSRIRVKLNKALFLGERPGATTRVRGPKLPGVMKPGNSDPDEEGRYWIFDVQKA